MYTCDISYFAAFLMLLLANEFQWKDTEFSWIIDKEKQINFI